MAPAAGEKRHEVAHPNNAEDVVERSLVHQEPAVPAWWPGTAAGPRVRSRAGLPPARSAASSDRRRLDRRTGTPGPAMRASDSSTSPARWLAFTSNPSSSALWTISCPVAGRSPISRSTAVADRVERGDGPAEHEVEELQRPRHPERRRFWRWRAIPLGASSPATICRPVMTAKATPIATP